MEIVGGPERITAKSSIGGRGRAGRDAAVRHRVLTAIDLFAGAGGFSLGLRRAGFDVVLANEYSIDAEWTYRHNILGDTPEGVFPKRPDDPSTRARKAYRAEVRQQMLKDREALPQNFERHMRGGDVREMLPDPWLRAWLERLSTAAGICTGAAAQKCTTGSVVACPRSPWEGPARGATRPWRGWRRPARGRGLWAHGVKRGVIRTVAGVVTGSA